MCMLQIIEIPRATQQINVQHLNIGTALLYFLRVQHGRRDLPILRQQQSIGRDRAEQVLNVIIRNEVMPAVVERPIRGERCSRCQDNRSRSNYIGSRNRRISESSLLNQPLDTE